METVPEEVKELVDSGIVILSIVTWVNSVEVLSIEIVVVTESTLKVYTVDERTVEVEYSESLLLDSSGTVNV